MAVGFASEDDDDKSNLSNKEPTKTSLLQINIGQNVMFSTSNERLSSFGVFVSPSSSMSSRSNLHRAANFPRSSIFSSNSIGVGATDPRLVIIIVGLAVIIIFVVIFTTIYEEYLAGKRKRFVKAPYAKQQVVLDPIVQLR